MDQTVAKNATTAADGKSYDVTYYNLDAIISIGYRVKSKNALLLKDFLYNYLEVKRRHKNEVIIYKNGDIELDVSVSPEEVTVYLTKEQLTILFDTTRQNIEYHIKNIYDSLEVDKGATCKEILQVQIEGNREVKRLYELYNLDMVILIGYRINSKRGIAFRKWANSILKEYLLKGYVINKERTLVTNENYINLINKVDSIDTRLSKLEKDACIDSEKIFFDGEYFDARVFIKGLISKANNNITLIDPYSDSKTLDFLKEKKEGVIINLHTSSIKKPTQDDIDSFNLQYGGLSVSIINTFHDRFLILDGKTLYHLGASLNYAGKKTFAISLMNDDTFIVSILKKIEK